MIGEVGVVSLLDMLRLYADYFVKSIRDISVWEDRCSRQNPDTIMTSGQVREISGYILPLTAELTTREFHSSAMKCERIRERLDGLHNRLPVTYGEMASSLKELRERIEDDLRSIVFLTLTPAESNRFSQPDKDWEEVIHRFPKMRHDIEESSKCFALARYGASLFHVLLVAEFGVIETAKFFRIAGDKPGWGDLERLQRLSDKKYADKSDFEKAHAGFLKDLLPLAIAMKDRWRHKISHVDNKLDWMDTDFSPEVATEIISATRGFMRNLSRDLPR